MTKIRIVLFTAVSALMLAWALPAMAHSSKATGTVVKVVAGKPTEFKFTLSAMSVKHGSVTFKVTNKGEIAHDFELCATGGTANTCHHGISTPVLNPGQSATLTVPIPKAGSYEYLCTVPGHAATGMKGDLKVT